MRCVNRNLTYVGKHTYLLPMMTDAWLRQHKLWQYFKSRQFLQALRVSIAETPSTFTICIKRSVDAVGDLRE